MNKIESYKSITSTATNQTAMKPEYSTNEELMCGEIKYNNRTYLVDFSIKDRLVNNSKKNSFVFVNENDIYPSYASNYKRVNYHIYN